MTTSTHLLAAFLIISIELIHGKIATWRENQMTKNAAGFHIQKNPERTKKKRTECRNHLQITKGLAVEL